MILDYFLVITESPVSLKDFEGSPKFVVDISNKYFQDDNDRKKILEKLIFLSQEYENHRMHLKTVYSKLINEIMFIKTKNVLIDNKELLLFIAEVTAFFF